MTNYSIAGSSGTTGLSHWTTPTPAGKLALVDPSDTTTAPAGSAGSDKWATVAQLGQVITRTFDVVRDYGADPSGLTDSTTPFQNAVTAAISAGGGIVVVPAGNYKITSTVTANITGVALYIQGHGRWATYVNYYGSGDCFRIYDTTSTRTVNGGGIFGLTIDGTNSSGSAASSGVHMGDMYQYEVNFASRNFSNFAGSKDVWFDNQNSWTEHLHGIVYVSAGTSAVVFDHAPGAGSSSTSSFDRAVLDIYLDQSDDAAWDSIVWQNGANQQNGRVSVYGNVGAASGTVTAALLRITGSSPSGTADTGTFSSLLNMELNVGVECDGLDTDNGPICLAFGSTDNFVASCNGALNYVPAAASFQAATNVSGNFDYAGNINGAPGLSSTNTMTTLNTSFINLFGEGPAGPGVISADGNNMPQLTTPAGLAGVAQQSQYAATSAVTVASSSTIASLGSLTVPANDVVAGARYRVTAHGQFSTTATPTITLDLRWGGTGGTLLTSFTTAALAATLTGVPVEIEGEIEFRTATTAVAWLKMTWRNSTSATAAASVMLASITTPVTVTTSSDEAFSLDWTWSANSSSNTVTIASSSFERVS